MENQNPYERKDLPQQGPPGQTPTQGPAQPYDYTSAHDRPSTDELIKRSYPKGRGGVERFVKTDKIVMAIAFGMFLLFLGAMIMTIIGTVRPPDISDYDLDEMDDYADDIRGHLDRQSLGYMLGGILIEFALLIVAFALIGGGILNKELENSARLGMLIAGGIVIAFELLFLTTLMGLAQAFTTITIP